MLATSSKFYVMNMATAEEKPIEKFLFGDKHPTGGIENFSLEKVKKALTDKGSNNVIVFEYKSKADVTFVFIDVDIVKSEEKPPVVIAATITAFNGQQPGAAAAVEAAKIAATSSFLTARATAISHCFDSFPLLDAELKKNGKGISQDLMDQITKKTSEYKDSKNKFMMPLLLGTASMSDMNKIEETLNEWGVVIYGFLRTILTKSEPVPQPVPQPSAANSGNMPVPACENCKKLRADLDAKIAENSQLAAQLKQAQEEKDQLKLKIDELMKKIESTPDPKPTPAPVFKEEPQILNSEIEFTPTKFAKNGKEEILFFVLKGYYKHYYIEKNCAAQLKLDTSKPVKLFIESYEALCHTDDPKERTIAEEYFVPKGEDFFICRGKIVP